MAQKTPKATIALDEEVAEFVLEEPQVTDTSDTANPTQVPEVSDKHTNEGSKECGPQESPGAVSKARTWVSTTFPGHEHAFMGGVAGLAVALLVFALGILRTLLIVVLVVVGVAVGQMLDGNPKIINAVRELLNSQDK